MAKFDLNDSSVVCIIGSGAGGGTLGNELAQKGIKVEFQTITEANHFFSKTEDPLTKSLDKYIKKETALY